MALWRTFNKKGMAKRGAKTKYKDSFPERAQELAEKGLMDKEIFKKLGICKTSFYNYQKEFPEFMDSIKKGKESPDDNVEGALYIRAVGYDYEEQVIEERISEDGTQHTTVIKTYKKHMPGDVTAGIFLEKNRRPEKWRDARNIELTDKDGASLAPKPIEVTIKRE
jgi:hypothetical protein